MLICLKKEKNLLELILELINLSPRSKSEVSVLDMSLSLILFTNAWAISKSLALLLLGKNERADAKSFSIKMTNRKSVSVSSASNDLSSKTGAVQDSQCTL